MEQHEIIEGNKLIAHFMESITGEELGEYTEKGWASACKYHTSWDWLMPVVEEIEGGIICANITIQNGGCYIDKELQGGAYADIAHCEAYPKINTVWEAVVAFIKWYNQQKTI